MKQFLPILFFCFSLAGSAQSFYTWPSTGSSVQNDEEFTVTANRTAYEVTLAHEFDNLPSDLKDKIKKYLDSTTHSEYTGMGTIKLPIVKRSGTYYVRINNSYNDLEKL